MLTNATVLIVEDSEVTRSLLKEVVLEENAKLVIEANDGQEAIDLLDRTYNAEKTVDLIICDINMPVMTGLDFVRNIKENERTKNIPIIMSTADGMASTVVEAVSLGVDDYIVKPINIEVLVGKIKKVLSRRK